MITKRLIAAALLLASASACVENPHSEKNLVQAMSACEKVQALIEGHSKGFPKLRGTKSSTPKMDIWKAHYHLVGDNCQVWGWGGRLDYVCNAIAPTEYIARGWYEKAKLETQQCLGNEWQLTESARKTGKGDKAIFRHVGTNTVVATHVVETQGVFKSEWATYYFVGDHLDEL